MTLTLPILCLVTDRYRLASRIGSTPDAADTLSAVVEQVAAAARAGVELIQVREADLSARALATLVRLIREQVAPEGARVLVNDRLDVALAVGAHGVHLKGASVPVADARRLASPTWLIGRSVHSVAEIERGVADGADYVMFGAVFATKSKPAGWQTAGLAGLQAAVQAASPLPVIAIGGIGPEQASGVALVRAAGVAAIDGFLPSGPTHIADTVQEAVRRMRIAFDSHFSLS